MIIKTLTGDNYEDNFKKIGVDKQLKHFEMHNNIENEYGAFIVSIDIDIDNNGNDSSTIIKMHKNEDNVMLIDNVVSF
jgi:hypothetical protein